MKKWLHIIGISGKTTANVALMFKEMGWFVTGTDHQFLPPANKLILEHAISYETEYNYENLTKDHWEAKLNNKLDINANPDIVMFVESITEKNKEYLYAKNKGIELRTYAQLLGEYLIKENSIVVVGTAGKTTTTALIALALKGLEFNPSFMIGAEAIDLADSIENTNGDWSVIEGDEYHNVKLSNGAKFLEYKPKFVLITNIGYEHQDIFPTKEAYVNEFLKLIKLVPADGLIVANYDDANVREIVKQAKAQVVYFSEHKGQDVYYPSIFNIGIEENLLEIFINKNDEDVVATRTKLLGKYNALNFTAVTALMNGLFEIGALSLKSNILKNQVIDEQLALNLLLEGSFEDFNGIKKRLEIIYSSSNRVLIDDFGVAPERAKNSIEVLAESYPEFEIIIVYEPNSGSRPKDKKIFFELYKDTFTKVSKVIIPELSNFNDELADQNDFVTYLKELKIDVVHLNEADILTFLKNQSENKKILVGVFSAYRLDHLIQKAKELFQKE